MAKPESTFGKGKSTLILVNETKYQAELDKAAKALSGKRVIYVSFTKTCASWQNLCTAKRINSKGMLFIDVLSNKVIEAPRPGDNCIMMSSPSALTEVSISIVQALKERFDYLIFDSLSAIGVYSEEKPVSRFLLNIISRARASNTKVVFYAIDSQIQPNFIAQVKGFVDEVISR